MSNMSYCRFNNTVIDLQDCQEVLDANTHRLITEEEDCEMSISSRGELRKAIELIEMCMEIAENFEDIDLEEHFKLK